MAKNKEQKAKPIVADGKGGKKQGKKGKQKRQAGSAPRRLHKHSPLKERNAELRTLAGYSAGQRMDDNFFQKRNAACVEYQVAPAKKVTFGTDFIRVSGDKATGIPVVGFVHAFNEDGESIWLPALARGLYTRIPVKREEIRRERKPKLNRKITRRAALRAQMFINNASKERFINKRSKSKRQQKEAD